MSALPIAVVGSGISGLSAAWLLSQTGPVVLLEADSRLGGHSNTVDLTIAGDGAPVPVDTGFIVYNPPSYPNLVAFFDVLGVETTRTNMSFAMSCDRGRYEYSGTGFNGIFAQRSNLFRPRHWLMVREILRFFKEVRELDDDAAQAITLDDFLAQWRFADAFRDEHILPMAAAIWSVPAQTIGTFPMASFARFFRNHGLLQVRDRPEWRTVVGGSRSYVSKVLAAVTKNGGEVRAGNAVSSIARAPDGVEVRFADGSLQRFSDVVLACHGDQARRILSDPSDAEARVLSAFRYSDNTAYLHRDTAQMPHRRNAWASWNYLARSGEERPDVCVSYWMNLLQPLATDTDVFVTLNPIDEIDPAKVDATFAYTHPIFDEAAMTAQRELWSLQGVQRTWFCGSYFGYGFHEDGAQAGFAVAEQLGGIRRPWDNDSANSRIHVGPVPALRQAA